MPRTRGMAGNALNDSEDRPGRRSRRPREQTPLQRALGLLVRREHSRKELGRKLKARGVDPEAVDAAVARLAEDGWQDVTSADINAYLSEVGVQGTAKDFRTWQAGLRALATLSEGADVKAAIADAAEHLGNTPAIARSSYVDPRLLELEVLPRAKGEDLEAWEPALLKALG